MSPPGRGGAPPANSGAPTNVIALHGPRRTNQDGTGRPTTGIDAADLSEAYALLALLAHRVRLSPGDRIEWLLIDVDAGTITWAGRPEADPDNGHHRREQDG